MAAPIHSQIFPANLPRYNLPKIPHFRPLSTPFYLVLIDYNLKPLHAGHPLGHPLLITSIVAGGLSSRACPLPGTRQASSQPEPLRTSPGSSPLGAYRPAPGSCHSPPLSGPDNLRRVDQAAPVTRLTGGQPGCCLAATVRGRSTAWGAHSSPLQPAWIWPDPGAGVR